MISRREFRNRVFLAACLAAPIAVVVVLVPPKGDFPLNDDWVYAKMVQALVERGELGFSPLSNAFAITQTLYAAPLVTLFGFSFTLLRLTSIFMAWLTVCFVAFTAREMGLPNRSALLAAATLLVNPLFVNLSYTFMTDVPFCAFSAISAYFFVNAIRKPSAASILFGNVAAVGAFFDRQFGALIPLAFVVATYPAWGRSRVHRGRAALALSLPWVFSVPVMAWLRVPDSQRLIVTYGRIGDEVFVAGLFVIIAILSAVWYLGMFAVPLSSALLLGLRRRLSRVRRPSGKQWRLVAVFAILVSFPTYLVFPPLPNILRNLGLGPALFSSVAPPGTSGMAFAPVQLPASITMPMALLFSLSGAFAAVMIDIACRGEKKASLWVRTLQYRFLVLLLGLMVVAPTVAMGGALFDRYFLPAVGPLLLVLAALLGPRPRPMTLVFPVFFCAATLTLSVVCQQDYIAWNAARWHAIELLRTKYGAADTEIDGGYEFNGMYTSDQYLALSKREMEVGKRWWVVGDTYMVSLIPKTMRGDAYTVIDEVPYYSWLGFETRSMYLLRKRTDSE